MRGLCEFRVRLFFNAAGDIAAAFFYADSQYTAEMCSTNRDSECALRFGMDVSPYFPTHDNAEFKSGSRLECPKFKKKDIPLVLFK